MAPGGKVPRALGQEGNRGNDTTPGRRGAVAASRQDGGQNTVLRTKPVKSAEEPGKCFWNNSSYAEENNCPNETARLHAHVTEAEGSTQGEGE